MTFHFVWGHLSKKQTVDQDDHDEVENHDDYEQGYSDGYYDGQDDAYDAYDAYDDYSDHENDYYD